MGRFQLFGNRGLVFSLLVSPRRFLAFNAADANGQLLRGDVFFHHITAEVRVKPCQPLLIRDMVGILPFPHHLGLGIHLPPDVQIFTGGPELIILHFPLCQGMGIDDGSPRLKRLAHHLLAGKVQIHVDRAVKVAVRVSADVNRPLGGVVFVGFLVRGLLYFKHMIAPLIARKTKSDTRVIKSLYENMVRYATELGVGNNESIAISYLFTSNLKELSGAVLHKTVFAFRLAYIIEIEKHLGIKLPIILDSPSGKEVDQANIQLMVNILKRDFSENQIIIASIFQYDFDTVNVIEIVNRLIE